MNESTIVQPLVSILVRSMDRPTLTRALDSAAAQTWPNLEIVVVAASGNSHRPLPAEHRGRPLRLVYPESNRRLPRPEAANLGLESARGEWLVLLDDDDEFLSEHLTSLLASPRPRAARVIYSRTRLLDEQGKDRGYAGSPGTHAQLCYRVRSTPGATLVHRSLIDEGVRFSPDFPICEDYDFQINCASRTEFHFVDAITCVWNAYSGDSGCGFGANENVSLHERYRAAVQRKWKKLLDRWIAAPGAAFALGREYLQGGQFPLAVDLLERAVASSPNDVNALNLCGMANLRHGDPLRAEALVLRALRILPDHAGLRENLRLIRARTEAKA